MRQPPSSPRPRHSTAAACGLAGKAGPASLRSSEGWQKRNRPGRAAERPADSCPSLQPGCHTGAPLTAAWLPSGPLAGGGARSPRCAFPCSPSPDTAVRAAMRVPEQRSDSQATPGPPKRLGAAESCWSGSKPCIVGLYALNRKKRFYFSEVPTAEKSFAVCRT